MTDKEIVFITGANTGIGYEAVKMLLESPKAYHILLGSRSEAKGKDAVAEVTKEFPNTKSVVEFVPVDVTDDASIENVLEIIRSKYGRLDVLVNNAGKSYHKAQTQNEKFLEGMRAS
jgi:NAD(P)-dependent dehydrogenase (short-subunit alcohol dehydrogenase family)